MDGLLSRAPQVVVAARFGSKAPVWPSPGDFGSASNIGNVAALAKGQRTKPLAR